MKKVLIILFLLVSLGFSQTAYEINFKTTFDDTLTWVRLSNQITIDLQSNTAYWQINGLKVTAIEPDSLGGLIHFRILVTKTVQVNYSGQTITRDAQKAATAAKFDLVYTGEEQ